MREPAAWRVDPGPRLDPARAAAAIRGAMRGPVDHGFDPPGWLLPHQREGARRIAGILTVFGGALLADAVGLGKTYVALAIATRYRRVTVAVPATLRAQWRTVAGQLGLTPRLVSHEALSRGVRVPVSDLIVVDEAHRFRNPATRRYDSLARGVRAAHVLLLTATPVVNGLRDLIELLRLALADGTLRAFGIPSLAAAAAEPPALVMHAVFPLVVARTPGVVRLRERLPIPRDGAVRDLPTLEPRPLARVLRALGRLRFPPLAADGRALLHHHLLLRLASSTEALAGSLRRHRRYVNRAMDAADCGEHLDRRAAVALLREADADQLALALATVGATPITTRILRAERRRLDRLLALLGRAGRDPKREALVDGLAAAGQRRVLVFTTARATALAVAAALGWRRVAVVSGSGGRIASGPIPLDEALARFAPVAQAGGAVPPALAVDVLIATDLASEGLNLQDADVVVHYDLPWNPLRLAQRVGRTVRLGGMHDQVDVWWFAPPESIERTLGTLERIRRKAAVQLSLPVPATSVVGRAHIVSDALERRENALSDAADPVHGHAVVRTAHGASAVIRWETSHGALREVLHVCGAPWPERDRSDEPRSVDEPIPPSTMAELRHAVRARARWSSCTTLSPASCALAKQVLAQARLAGARRDRRLLSCLDAVLTRLREGVAVGAERELADHIDRATEVERLAGWIDRHPPRDPRLRSPTVETVLAGSDSPASCS